MKFSKLFEKILPILLILAFGVFLAIGIPAVRDFFEYFGWRGHVEANKFQYYFDAVTALFSGLTLLFVIIGLWQQREELKSTREELKIAREIAISQENALALQNKAEEKQMFENTFFTFLNILNDHVKSMEEHRFVGRIEELQISKTEAEILRAKILVGKEVFGNYCRYIDETTANGVDCLHFETKEQIDIFYEDFTKFSDKFLSPYFRMFYRILKFIDSSEIQDKKFYTSTIRAQLSNNELRVIAYNCVSKYGRRTMKPLVEKYSILKHLKSSSSENEFLRKQFAPLAFISNSVKY